MAMDFMSIIDIARDNPGLVKALARATTGDDIASISDKYLDDGIDLGDILTVAQKSGVLDNLDVKSLFEGSRAAEEIVDEDEQKEVREGLDFVRLASLAATLLSGAAAVKKATSTTKSAAAKETSAKKVAAEAKPAAKKTTTKKTADNAELDLGNLGKLAQGLIDKDGDGIDADDIGDIASTVMNVVSAVSKK